jgi:UrcA family protein
MLAILRPLNRSSEEIDMLRSTICTAVLATIGLVLGSSITVAQSPSANAVADVGPNGDDQEVRRKVVRFEDLDLSHEAGVKTLYGRISAAADSVCSPFGGTRALAGQLKWRDCRDTAVASAVAQIDHPLLTEHHRRSTSGGPEIE